MSKKITSRFRAFTLVELLVVIAIIMILAGMLFPAFQMMRDRSRKEESKSILSKIDAALRQYENDFGHYPFASNKWAEGSWDKDEGVVENGELIYAALEGGDYPTGDLTGTTGYEKAVNVTEAADNKIFVDGWKKPVIYLYVSIAHAASLNDTATLRAAWWGRANKITLPANISTGATDSAPQPEKLFRKEFELWSAGPDKKYTLISSNATTTKDSGTDEKRKSDDDTDNATVTNWE